MNLKSTLRKAAGLLVELPPEEEAQEGRGASTSAVTESDASTDRTWAELEKAAGTPTAARPTKTVEQIVREGSGPNLDQITVAADKLPATSPDGSLSFSAIYQSANLPPSPFTAEQVLDMLAALPAEVPLETRRQMIKVSISAMGKSIGATPENIVADASRKLAALSAYTDHLAQLTTDYTTAAERKAAELQAQIEDLRKGIAAAQQRLTHESEQCTAESHRLDEVLEFFSLDVPPSKFAPPAESPAPANTPEQG